MKYFIKCWKHYADFKGRARRKEYWMFLLFNYIISFVFGIVYYIGVMAQMLSNILNNDSCDMTSNIYAYMYVGTGWVFVIFCIMIAYSLAVLLPTLALMARRLHDIGKKGTWLLLLLAPLPFLCILFLNMDSLVLVIVMSIITCIINFGLTVLYIVLGCIKGQIGENQYGPNPKEIEEAEMVKK